MAGKVAGLKPIPHLIKFGTSNIIIDLSDVYSSIGNDVGVSKVTGDLPDFSIGLDVGTAIINGIIMKMRIAYLSGSTTKYSDVVVSTSKISSALKSVIGKTYLPSTTIQSAYFPRRRQLG